MLIITMVRKIDSRESCTVWKRGGLETWRSGKLSLESDGLESCSRENDVAPIFGLTYKIILAIAAATRFPHLWLPVPYAS